MSETITAVVPDMLADLLERRLVLTKDGGAYQDEGPVAAVLAELIRGNATGDRGDFGGAAIVRVSAVDEHLGREAKCIISHGENLLSAVSSFARRWGCEIECHDMGSSRFDVTVRGPTRGAA